MGYDGEDEEPLQQKLELLFEVFHVFWSEVFEALEVAHSIFDENIFAWDVIV